MKDRERRRFPSTPSQTYKGRQCFHSLDGTRWQPVSYFARDVRVRNNTMLALGTLNHSLLPSPASSGRAGKHEKTIFVRLFQVT